MFKNFFFPIAFSVLFVGCSTKRTFWPSMQTWKDSLVSAATDSGTLIPIIGATIIYAGGFDDDISNWAIEETPIFGSQEKASEASNNFLRYSRYGMNASALFVYEDDEYLSPVLERLLLGQVSISLTFETTNYIKEETQRERPNKSDRLSFPSLHASSAFAGVAMANNNIDSLPLSEGWKQTAKFVETSFGAATAWARVEAGEHYPSDVLAGAALGNFISLVIHDAFLGKENSINIQSDTHGRALLTFKKKF